MKNYIDSIVDALMEVHLFEMSVQRKEIVNRMNNLSFQIADHISLIVCYPDNPAKQHWIHELGSWLDNISYMRFDDTKTLKESDYLNSLWARLFQNTNFLKEIFSKKVSKKGLLALRLSDVEYKHKEDIIKKFFVEVAKKLATKENIDVKQILFHLSV